MMGPSYYYYDASPYVEDVSTEFHIHDCMWAGECCACQPAHMPFSNPTVSHPPSLNNGTVPITVGGSGYVTLTSSRHEVPHKLRWSERPQASHASETPDSSAESSSSVSPESSPRPASNEAQKSSSNKVSSSVKSNGSGSNSSSDNNKKLRHREVEKNRHRQLQAMVKTLSEKIPGRLDKETQVQTMKRAARYCVYLREVVKVVESMSLGQPIMSKERLEKLYKSSYESVEHIMAQSAGTR